MPQTVATKERFIQISALIEGKSPKECFERFKLIVAKLKAEKEAEKEREEAEKEKEMASFFS